MIFKVKEFHEIINKKANSCYKNEKLMKNVFYRNFLIIYKCFILDFSLFSNSIINNEEYITDKIIVF